jgi:glycosyltransferase involved in cell wall biosynthesis
MQGKKVLFLYTENFPYGSGESFLENEIAVATEFASVYILPASTNGNADRISYLPKNVQVLGDIAKTPVRTKIDFFDLFFFTKIIIKELIFSKHSFAVLARIRELLAKLKRALILSRQIHAFINRESISVDLHYSYWMNDWALALAVLKCRKHNNLNFIFRVLGYDIYDERHKYNYLPFRYFIYSKCKKVYAVSKTSMNYLLSKKMFLNKVSYAYLGTSDFGLSPVSENSIFTIVSCSNLIPLKRVHLIPEILKHIHSPVKWIHIGSGPELAHVKSAIEKLPGNIITDLLPHFPMHAQLVDFYKSNAIDLFIHLSETEGLGVVHLEALSFGIPVFTTNVGGASEFISNDNGNLFEVNFNPAKIAKDIELRVAQPKISMENRLAIHNQWRMNFECDSVYRKFYNEILN